MRYGILVVCSLWLVLGHNLHATTNTLRFYGQLPLSFEANQGQTDSGVRFLSRGPGYTLFLTSRGEAVFSPSAVQFKLIGANKRPQTAPDRELPGKSNYFIGNDPTKWRTNIPTYAQVRYRNVYPGIDLAYYGNEGRLEYDFVVAPGADPRAIRFQVDGAEKLHLNAQGDLIAGEIRLHKPAVYQEVDGVRKEIAGRFVRRGREVGFCVAAYDRSRPLVIDPVLSYSTYAGGSGSDVAWGIVLEASGNVFVAGRTTSTNFPTAGPLQAAQGGGTDVFVMKLNASGSALIYSTFLGGTGDDNVSSAALAVDSSGNAYLTGWTTSRNFPTTAGAQQTAFGGGSVDAFLTKLNASGSSLVYSTFLGGQRDDESLGIVLDAADNAYITGDTNSADFFVSANAFQKTLGGGTCGPFNATYTCQDAFVAKFSPSGSAIYSTLLGGDNEDTAFGIALDSSGNAYVAGRTNSKKFPTTANAAQGAFGGGRCLDIGAGFTFFFKDCYDVFVTKLDTAGSALVYSTYLGGDNEDVATDIALDAVGNAYLTGWTWSANFPATPGVFQAAYAGLRDAFVARLDPTAGPLVYSTYLGAGGSEEGHALAVDASGSVYVAGRTDSSFFPTESPLQSAYGGASNDAFVTRLNTAGTALLFSTWLGGTGEDRAQGIAVDPSGNVYLAGFSDSTNFPTTAGSFQAASRGGLDAFVVKIDPSPGQAFNPTPTLKTLLPASAAPKGSNFTLTVNGTGFTGGSVVRWNGNDRPTSIYSATLAQVEIPASDIAAAGTAQITAFNPPPRGGASNALSFSIANPPNTGGLVSAGHYGARVAAGAIISIFGVNLASSVQAAPSLPLPTTLANTKVTIGGTDAPLFYVSPGQINAQIPFELSGRTSVSFQVTVGGTAQPSASFTLSSAAPAIFTVTQDGKGSGAILGPRGAISAANPVSRGEAISLFVTGLGSVTPSVKSGTAAPADPLSKTNATITVTIGGVDAAVTFSGLAPGFVGLYQINVTVPANAPTGDNVPIVVRAGDESSNVATIAIR